MHRRSFLTASASLAIGGPAARRARAQTDTIPPTSAGPSDWQIPDGTAFSAPGPDGVTLSGMAYGPEVAPGFVLIHGLGQSRLAWDRQIAALAGQFRFVTYDLRGHGDSGKPDRPDAYSTGALWGGDFAAIIEAQALRRPTLVGWSLGGQVIGQYLIAHRTNGIGGVNLVNAVAKLDPALLSPTALDFSGKLASTDLRVRTRAIAEFLKACFAAAPDAETLETMIAYDGMVPRLLQQEVVKTDAEGMGPAFADVGGMMVTYGALARLTRPEMSRRILDLNARATFSVYDGIGHSPFFKAPDRFNRELVDVASSL